MVTGKSLASLVQISNSKKTDCKLSELWDIYCYENIIALFPVLRIARKCKIKHWFPCGADGLSVGQLVYGHVTTKSSQMGRFF